MSFKPSYSPSAGTVEYIDSISAERLYPLPNECPTYNTKQSDGEAPVTLEMWTTPSLPSLPGPLWPGVVAPDMVLSIGQIELFDS